MNEFLTQVKCILADVNIGLFGLLMIAVLAEWWRVGRRIGK